MSYITKVALATAVFTLFVGFWFLNINSFPFLLDLIYYCNIREFFVTSLGWLYICIDNQLVDIFINCAISYSIVEVSVVFFDRIIDTFKTA